MTIDTREQPKINIKRLAIPEPVRRVESAFDPERDLIENDWINMRSALDQQWDREWIEDYVRHAANLIILFPNRREDLPLHTADSVDLRGRFSPTDEFTYLQMGRIKAIHPQDPTVTSRPADIVSARRDIDKLFDQDGIFLDRNRLNDVILSTFILSPEKLHMLRNEKLHDFLQNCIVYRNGGPVIAGLGDGFFNEASGLRTWVSLKLLYPEEFKPLTPEEWEKPKRNLEQASSLTELSKSKPELADFARNFAQLAVNMKLLAAKEINMTPKGVRVIMPGDIQPSDNPSPLPIVRKF